MNRFNRPRLITFDDPVYQRHVAQMQLQRANQRAMRPPSQRDLFGGEVEQIVRRALGEKFALANRRIVEYEERIGRNWQRKYRELDGVVIDGPARVQVFEIKASRRAGALHRAIRQLRETQAIMQLAFRTVGAAIVLVDTGIVTAAEQAELAATDDAPERLPQMLAEALADHPEVRQVAGLPALTAFPDQIELAVVTLNELIALAGDTPLSLDWDVEDTEGEANEPPPPTLYSTPDDDDESPFAAALRKAQRKEPRRAPCAAWFRTRR